MNKSESGTRMNQGKNGLPPTSGAKHHQQTTILQTSRPSSQMTGRPVAPPVYRPQPLPKVLQGKIAIHQQSNIAQSSRRPVAPPVYRPESKAQPVQAKMGNANTRKPKLPQAPAAYRPQPLPKVLQTKTVVRAQEAQAVRSLGQPVAPPAYRPQPTPRVLQTKKPQSMPAVPVRDARTPHAGFSLLSKSRSGHGIPQKNSSSLLCTSRREVQTVQLKARASGFAPLLNPSKQFHSSTRGTSSVIQRRVQRGVTGRFLGRVSGTHAAKLAEMSVQAEKLQRTIRYYDTLNPATDLPEAKKHLKLVVQRIKFLQVELDWLIPGLAGTQNQTDEDKTAYRALIKFQDDLTKVSKATNDEAARILNVTRAGPGNRPDANNESALARSMAALNLTQAESGFKDAFVQNQGGGWKEQREALSAIWAKRGNQFTNLTPGKGNDYGSDVEYQTTDAGKPVLWDQKTIYSDQLPFDGRIVHTHQKNKDVNDRGVGLLFDSTFENSTNYEKAWLGINEALLSGQIAPSAVKEVRAPNLNALQSELYVDMVEVYGGGSVEANVKWAEANLAGQVQGGFEVIANARLGGTGYANVAAGTAVSHSRYTNNRNWLTPGVYDEYAVAGALPNVGKGRFVATEDHATIYLTVTHYKPYTVKLANDTVLNRKAFFRVI